MNVNIDGDRILLLFGVDADDFEAVACLSEGLGIIHPYRFLKHRIFEAKQNEENAKESCCTFDREAIALAQEAEIRRRGGEKQTLSLCLWESREKLIEDVIVTLSFRRANDSRLLEKIPAKMRGKPRLCEKGTDERVDRSAGDMAVGIEFDFDEFAEAGRVVVEKRAGIPWEN
jgi:hypothetical protein